MAYIFHPSEPRATPEPHEAMLSQVGLRYERLMVADFTLLIVDR